MVALALLLVSLFLPRNEVAETFWPDGSPRTRAEGRLDDDGHFMRHGAWSEWHENGELAAEGSYSRGKRSERWATFFLNGKRESRGRYTDGERDGLWKTWHANGKKNTSGKYDEGWRTGEWDAFTPDGDRDEARSGEYETLEHRVGRRVRWRAETLRGVREGRFASWWPDGEPQCEGAFEQGAASGEWRFWHEDGSLDPDFVSGTWRAGFRGSGLELAGDERVEGAPSLAPLADDSKEAESVRAELDRALAASAAQGQAPQKAAKEGADPAPAAPPSYPLPRAHVPIAIDRLLELDPEREEHAERGQRLEQQVLRPSAGGHGFGWRASIAAEDVAHNRRVQQRWRSLWRIVEDDPGFWYVDLLQAERWSPQGSDPLTAPPVARVTPAERCADGLLAPRFAERRPPRKRPEREREEAIASAIDWLKRTQTSSGSWTVAPEDRPENWTYDLFEVGVTGLACLTLLADGSTPASGPAAEELARGLAWILAHVDPETGLVPRRSSEAVYSQAAATWAVCEALAAYESPVLRSAARRMVEGSLAWRSPFSGWRYEYPPSGASDTSVTAWMLLALTAAREAGLEVDLLAFKYSLDYFEGVTAPDHGRVGYDAPLTLSARTVANEAYPREAGEAMTAAALLSRLLAPDEALPGPRSSDRRLGTQVALLRHAPPRWDGRGHHDLYYWQWASAALWQTGDEDWEAWDEELRSSLVPVQASSGVLAGSWDPLGPWATMAGRVYSTTMCTLSLLAPRRYARRAADD